MYGVLFIKQKFIFSINFIFINVFIRFNPRNISKQNQSQKNERANWDKIVY